MNESTRTLSYVGVAAVSVVLAAFFAPANPKAPDEFAEVGKPFFADFVATDAKSMSVVSFNEDSTRSKNFQVEEKDGKWVIGSHRNYPADGKDRLAKTAASVIGIKKEQFATKDPEQFVAMQVIDPLDEDAKKLKGRGQRITLKDGSGKVLVDYIIGKRVPNRDSYYYIRNPAEKSVYMAKLTIDLSTKFADWIESDLLQLQGENLNEIDITKYAKKGDQLAPETSILKRAKPADPWTLEGLDESKEEVNQDEIRTMTTALNDLKILGVREKPEGLSAVLKGIKGAVDQNTVQDLALKGFYLSRNGALMASEGEMAPITDGGVAYTLRFGEVFAGSELEMETGLEADQRKQNEKEGKKDKADEKGSTKSRYVFITADFVAESIGPKPEPPGTAAKKPAVKTPADTDTEAKPSDETPAADKPKEDKPKKEDNPKEDKPAEEQPAADKPAAEEKPEAKPDEPAKKGDCQDEAEKKQVDEAPAEKKAETKPEAKPEATEPKEPAADAKPAAVKKEAPKAAAPKGPTPEEQAKADLLAATKKYEDDLKAYNEKLAKGQKKVKELNERFADWYYVISEENFLKLRLSRASLVKEKTKPEPKPGEAAPGESKPDDAKPDAKPEDKPAADAPKPDAEKPAEPKPEEPKAEEKKPEAKKPTEEKPAEEKPKEDKPEEKKPAE